MRKFTVASPFISLVLPSLSKNGHSNPSKLLLSLITSSFTFSQNRACSSTPDLTAKSSVLGDYLMGSLKFSKPRALIVSGQFAHIKSLEKPQEVVLFFKALGFSNAHIQSLVHGRPEILFANIEKTIKPKVMFFQGLGFSGPLLGALVSKNPIMLKYNVDRTLRPCICLIKKVLENDGRHRTDEKVNDDLFRILVRCNGNFFVKSRLEENIQHLENCGVIGSQLSSLVINQTRIIGMRGEKLAALVSRALDMGFTIGSKMFVHGIRLLNGWSIKALNT